jgi:Tfp pilus assembly protein PilF
VPAYNVSHNLALAYLGTGRPKEALKEINDSIPFEKEDPWRAQYILALAAQRSGDFQLAAQTLRTITEAKPDFSESETEIPYSRLIFKSKYWPLYP